MLKTTNAAGRIRDESLMNLGGRGLRKWLNGSLIYGGENVKKNCRFRKSGT
jgi:hypothetical protein